MARLGGVSIVNTLGSGVLENPGLLPFFPGWLSTCWASSSCCRRCLPGGAATRGRRHVLANLERLVVKPIARRNGPTAVFPWELSRERRDDLRRRIEAHPAAWVGQEPLQLASTPTLTLPGSRPGPVCCGPSPWPARGPTPPCPAG